MYIELLKGKIHRATVTEADLNYVGSLTLDEDLMLAAGFQEYEKIEVLDITNGNRISTYIIKGKRGSGHICINGAAAHHIHIGDLVEIQFSAGGVIEIFQNGAVFVTLANVSPITVVFVDAATV